MKPFRCLQTLLMLISLTTPQWFARGQAKEASTWASEMPTLYRIIPNITYLTANNYEAKLDLYLPREAKEPVPTVIHIHGGGWVGGAKETDLPYFLPYLEMGWAVVNVEYRLGHISLAPAAVEDCRCALAWVWRNAKEYNLDTSKLVVTGFSAGGHLSLTTGMLPASAGLDRECNPPASIRVAAVVNWYGITDVLDLLDGPNMKDYAVQWLSSLPDREAVARRVSPLTYVRPGLPPIMTVHGNADPVVPYDHAVRLHDGLTKAGVPNRLLTIQNGKHGGFTREEYVKIYEEIRQFLNGNGITRRR
jgi:acetyl esterase/lipase